MQAAASKIQEAQSAEAQARADADSAQATAESRDEEAANLRRSLAELQGALSGQEGLEVVPFQTSNVYHARLDRACLVAGKESTPCLHCLDKGLKESSSVYSVILSACWP